MIRGLNAVFLHTRDVPRLVHFYRDLVGLDLRMADHGSGPHAECELGGVHFAIHPEGPEPAERGTMTFALHVDDVHAEHARLSRLGVEFEAPPNALPFGGVVAKLRDPDGNGVYLMTWQSEMAPGRDP